MKKKTNRLLSILLTLVMLLGMLPTTAVAAEIPIPVTTEGNTYSLFTEENLEGQFGTTFLYVVKSGDRYYTPAHPGSIGDFDEKDSVAAVDITAYWDEDTNTFSGIPNSANVGVMQYQSYTLPEYGTSALFLDGNVMFSLSVPFEEDGETWFDGGIRYYDREQTYSYSRALWEATGDGSGYFYDRYTDWYDTKETVYGVLALKNGDCFALRNCSEAFAKEETIDVNGYLYAAPCGHAAPEHSVYVAPTCMDKGCKEYWYCVYCDTYFKEATCTNAYDCKPILPALDHNYGDTACANCGNPVPVYTKITSYEQFKTVDPNASFIAVAEIADGNGGTDYYVLKKEISAPDADIDENGSPDILQVDENGNDVADILEVDADGDGVADAMAYDGFYSSEPDGVLDDEEIWEYLFALENEYTDGYIPSLHTIGAIPVTPAQDGTISVKNLGALEWVMERRFSDAELEDQYYGGGATVKDYENDFLFRIPNFWIRPVVTISNNYYQQPYEQGDSKWWGVLFGKDAKELNDLFFTESYPADAAVLYTESFGSLNTEGQIEHALRFLVNGEKKNFIMTSDSFWEELEGTQHPVYLYCSDAGDEVHEHIFGDWTSISDEIHKRTCTVDGCSEYELASHTPGAECTPDPENYELGHWVTCTECGGQFHEYHTREEAGRYYPNYWRDTGNGIHHVVNCTKCLGPVEYAEHDWSDWYNGNKEIDGEWVRGHYRRCEDFPCEAIEWQAECIYDEGVVTTAPTCLETGVMTYTCMADPPCELDTKTYTEEIPALDHDWGEWLPMDGDPTREQRVCKRDPNHTEEREVIVHEHVWSDWTPDGDENHKRTCSAEGCTVKTETEEHTWGDWVITTQPTCVAEGVRTATCASCNATKTMAIPAVAENHNFSGWESISDTQHSRSCQNNGCNATETADHDLKSEVINWETCEYEGQGRDYCETCGYEKFTTRPALNHDWGDWTVTKQPALGIAGEEQRVCRLDENHVHLRSIDPLYCHHTCAACGGCSDNACPSGARKCDCNQPEILPYKPLDDNAISFTPNFDIPEGQTVSIVATEITLPSAADNAASQPAASVNPYEKFILNNAEGMKVETVFEIKPVVDQTGEECEIPTGKTATVKLYVGEDNARAIDQGEMFLVHITESGTVTYGKTIGNAAIDVKKDDGGNYTGEVEFTTDGFSPFVLVSLPGELEINFNAKGATGSCTVSVGANQAYNCSLYIAVYDAKHKMLAVRTFNNVNLGANPQYTLSFTGTASYVKAFMLELDGSLIPRCAAETDGNLSN